MSRLVILLAIWLAIRLAIKLAVKLVGGVPGFLSEANGPTHQAIEDIATAAHEECLEA